MMKKHIPHTSNILFALLLYVELYYNFLWEYYFMED